jgi:DtxR family Mn-dependent transcriptional regulator
MTDNGSSLSRSLEDYLEAIYNLKIANHVARVKDIADVMGVKMPSVTEAIRTLVSKGLVIHEPYENVELTDEGIHLAKNVVHRHNAVKDFLVGVLGLNDEDAEAEACGIEHAIRHDTLERLMKFADFVKACDNDHSLRLAHFQYYMKHGSYPPDCSVNSNIFDWQRHHHRRHHFRSAISTKLSDQSPGTKGKIVRVFGHGPIRKRLLEMGVTSNADFEVIRTAPLGDPIEIKIRGYRLTLRKSEAENIEVQI